MKLTYIRMANDEQFENLLASIDDKNTLVTDVDNSFLDTMTFLFEKYQCMNKNEAKFYDLAKNVGKDIGKLMLDEFRTREIYSNSDFYKPAVELIESCLRKGMKVIVITSSLSEIASYAKMTLVSDFFEQRGVDELVFIETTLDNTREGEEIRTRELFSKTTVLVDDAELRIKLAIEAKVQQINMVLYPYNDYLKNFDGVNVI